MPASKSPQIAFNKKFGVFLSYGIYTKPPTITPGITTTARINTRVQGVAISTGQATFVLSKQLVATYGIYDKRRSRSARERKSLTRGLSL
ncbi:hypothetical protein F5Y10DRAFT_11681 [Nemania abortiva]|nr:hypothetical protein F5Y10DRAFT_11681 [Nemania abortiva]